MARNLPSRWRVDVPDGAPFEEAARRVTHLGIGAHQDDLEFMALHGILACHDGTGGFGAVVCTDGRGSVRAGPLADLSSDALQALREKEQEEAARLGRYAFAIQLRHPSASVRPAVRRALEDDLLRLLRFCRPQVVYTHNPADRHATHVGVFQAVLAALRALPPGEHPRRVYGCEVWGDLDWLPRDHRVVLDVSAREDLAAALAGVFQSQIAAGKRYDTAVEGRRRAHATFLEPREADGPSRVTLAMDLSPLLANPTLDPADYVGDLIAQFRAETAARLRNPGC